MRGCTALQGINWAEKGVTILDLTEQEGERKVRTFQSKDRLTGSVIRLPLLLLLLTKKGDTFLVC